MKKIFILLIVFSFMFGAVAMAQKLGGSELKNAVGGVVDSTPLETRVGGIIAAILGMLGTVFLVLTIYAGVLWMTASGEEAKIEKAKEIITAAVIGLAIVLSAYTITYFVGSKLGAGAPSNRSGSCAPADVCKDGGGTETSDNACSPDTCSKYGQVCCIPPSTPNN